MDPSALPDSFVSSWEWILTWGQDYDHGISPALWHGIKVNVTMWADAPGVPAHYAIEIESCFLGTNYTNSGSGIHDWYLICDILEHTLAGVCGEAQFDSGDIVFSLADTDGGAETVKYTIRGPLSRTNAYFDHDKNCSEITPTVSGVFASPGAASCPANAETDGPEDDIDAITGCQWAPLWSVVGAADWQELTVKADNDDERYLSSPCTAEVGDIVVDPPPYNSKWITLSASIADHYTKEFLLNQTWTCATNPSSYVVKYYDFPRRLETHAISIRVQRMQSPCRQREITTVEFTDDNGTTSNNTDTRTVTDPACVIIKNTVDYLGTWHTICSKGPSPGTIPPCAFPDEYIKDVDAPTADPYCENSIDISQAWLTPDCFEGTVDLAIHPECGHARLILSAGLDPILQRSDNGLEWTDHVIPFSMDYGGITMRKVGGGLQVILTYSDAGTVYLSTSGDFENWSMPITHGAGTHSHPVSLEDGRVFAYRFDGTSKIIGKRYDAALNLLEAEFDAVTSVDDASFGVDKSDYGQSRQRVIITCRQAGDMVIFESPDGINFA